MTRVASFAPERRKKLLFLGSFLLGYFSVILTTFDAKVFCVATNYLGETDKHKLRVRVQKYLRLNFSKILVISSMTFKS